MRIIIILALAIAITFVSANYINEISLHGAQTGGSGISKETVWEARMSPNTSQAKFYPFALGIGSIIGFVVFIGACIITRPQKSKK